MAKILVCQQFKTPAFSNGNTKEWDKRVEEVNNLKEKYGFNAGVKELFLELLQLGNCISYDIERISQVKKVLQSEGYCVDKITEFIGVRT